VKFSATVPGMTMYQAANRSGVWSNDVTTEQMQLSAARADELGYHSISVSTHMVMRTGEWAENMGARWPHSLTAAGFILGATRRIPLQCLVVVPYQQPIELAKALATLDWMSGGRLIPMLMTGYMDWEFELLGVPFEDRGRIMDEYVEAMIELWTSELPEYAGRHVRFKGIVFEPKPVQKPLPLYFGGRTKAALRRIARFGAGWISYATPHAEMPAAIRYLREQPEFRQNPRPLEIGAHFLEATRDVYTHKETVRPRQVVGNDAILEQLRHLASLGITIVRTPLSSKAGKDGNPEPIRSFDEYLDRLAWFAEEIMPEAARIEARLPVDPGGVH
jgi:probable F420-dependent oxidoreductase